MIRATVLSTRNNQLLVTTRGGKKHRIKKVLHGVVVGDEIFLHFDHLGNIKDAEPISCPHTAEPFVNDKEEHIPDVDYEELHHEHDDFDIDDNTNIEYEIDDVGDSGGFAP